MQPRSAFPVRRPGRYVADPVTETRRIEREGVGLHVELDGPADGPPVVFLHGVGSSGRTWEWVPDELTRGRRVVRVDLRGHGRSEHAPGTYDLEHYGTDAAAVVAETAGRPAVLVGNSLGGVVAWWLAQNRPELVAAALLEDPPLLAGETPASEAGRFRDVFHSVKAVIVESRRLGLTEEETARHIGAIRWGPPGTPTLAELLTEDGLATMAFGYARLDVGVIDGAIDGTTLAAAETRSPVRPPVVIAAADDAAGAAFGTDDEARLAGRQPAVEVLRIPGSGHRIHDMREHRETFAGHLRRFLDARAG
jgi:pimeloyl-ACP methyl ester carboxylesterase